MAYTSVDTTGKAGCVQNGLQGKL